MGEQIDNFNYLSPTGFRVTISREFYPHLQYFAQTVQHPSLNVNSTEVGYKRISSVPFVGDKIQVGSITLDLLMDENLESYKELYDWMHRMVNENHRPASARFQFGDNPIPTSTCDMKVTILTSANNVNHSFLYKNSFPVSIGDVQFNATSDGTYITYPVTFRFDYFEFI